MSNRTVLRIVFFVTFLILGTFVYILSFRFLELGLNKNLLIGEITLLFVNFHCVCIFNKNS